MDIENHYSKAPITEALLDIQVETPEGLTPLALVRCQDPVRDEYPTQRGLKAAFAHLEFGQELSASTRSQDLGYAFVSDDGKQLFQVRTSGFTANRLAPYSSWKDFSNEARRLWKIYLETAKPRRVTRIALRYINRIDIPQPVAELKDYFNTLPDVAPKLPQSIAGFFMQIMLPLPDAKAMVNIVETLVEPPVPGVISVLLDLDLFRTAELPNTEEGLWDVFEILRVHKNEVFRACITEKTEEMIR